MSAIVIAKENFVDILLFEKDVDGQREGLSFILN